MRRIVFDERWSPAPGANWQRHCVGGGLLLPRQAGLRFAHGPTSRTVYTNAQVDDYQGLPRSAFRWRPPLTLTVRARFSHTAEALRGTAGFGFWNDPLAMTGARRITLPSTIWFFYSSHEGNMQLAQEAPGYGLKAATIDAWRWPFFLLAPVAPLAMPLMRFRPFYRLCWPIGQRAIGVNERLITVDMTSWHTYNLYWGRETATFEVDSQPVMQCEHPPQGPLGLVIWKDNQGMILTPWSLPRSLLIAGAEEQWLEVAWVKIVI
jgi:hypothetical protein